MSNPVKVADKPFVEEVEADKSYFICTCGLSANLPFCDGSHKGSDHRPTKYTAPKSKKVFFCGCAKSSNHPLCDGSHTH